MAIRGIPVGSDTQSVVTVGDPTTASNLGAVVPVADSTNVTGKYAPLALAAKALRNNLTGNYDVARSSPGTTGVQAVSGEGLKNTFSAAVDSFTPVATATDILVIPGNGTTTVRVLRITISGIATAAATIGIQLIKRSAANTGGTSANMTVVPNDSNDSAANTTPVTYSVNPTLGTAVGTCRARKLNLGAAGAAGTVEWKFTDVNDQAIVLRAATQSLAINWGGAAVPSGTSLDIEIEWVEDNS